MGLLKKLGVAVAVVVVLVAVGWFLGIFGLPTFGVVDIGDWGEVTEERTEVTTEVWVKNPNPIGIVVGSTLRVDYEVAMNDVVLGQGNRTGIAIRKGNQTKTVHTTLHNDRLPEWWVQYVRANETVRANVSATVKANVGLTASHTFRRQRTMLENETPMIDAMSGAAESVEGSYPDGPTTLYEVQRGWATWGAVNESATVVDFHFRVHNPSPVPVPARPDGLRATVAMNDVEVIRTQGTAFSTDDVGPDTLLQPGETREIVLSVRMDNSEVDDWFTSHVRNGERTDVSVEFQLAFENPQTGATVALPPGGVSYTCEFRTGILVDGQETATTCGSGSGVGAALDVPAVRPVP